MFTRRFIKHAAERAVKTFVQAFGAAAGLGVPGLSVLDLDWKAAAAVGAAAALGSVVTSVGSAQVGEPDTPYVLQEQR